MGASVAKCSNAPPANRGKLHGVRRPIVLLLFAAVFVAELGWSGISPLLPTYQDTFGLTDFTTGLILTTSSVGILLVSLPASALSRRFAVRTLTLWGLAALTVGNITVGMSHTYGGLLLGRAGYGVGLGIMWVTGTAWLFQAAGHHAPRALALTTAIVGAGSLVGPALTGWLAEWFDAGTPFVLLGLLTGVMLVTLLLAPSPAGREKDTSPPLGDMLRAARADVLMVASLVLTLAVSMMWMSAELLVPLRLDEHGFDAAQIGLAFSVASLVFIGSSAITSARAERRATMRFAAAWTGIFSISVLIAALGTGTGTTIAFLIAVGITTGVMISLTYPLGAVGAREGGFSVAVVGALLNLMWAGAGLVGPTVGGALAERADDRIWFVGLAILGTSASGWMWRRRDRAHVPLGTR
jgi:DHA1 family solute carrier family 18 vesicular amine transporter 1/2